MLQRKGKCKVNINVNYFGRHRAGRNKKCNITESSINFRTQAFCIIIKNIWTNKLHIFSNSLQVIVHLIVAVRQHETGTWRRSV